MKKQLLLPFLFLALMFTGCQEPDDDVDMPEPQKPVAERILGDWLLIKHTETYPESADGEYIEHNPETYIGDIFHVDSSRVDLSTPGVEPCYCPDNASDSFFDEYTLTESKGKTYIVGFHGFSGHTEYEINNLTDSTMAWQMTDSLAALSNGSYSYGFRSNLEFKKVN